VLTYAVGNVENIIFPALMHVVVNNMEIVRSIVVVIYYLKTHHLAFQT